MASDTTNITAIGDRATTAQALSLNHSTRYDTAGEIDAVYIDGRFVTVDSVEFADYVTSAVEWTAEDYDALNY